MVVADYYDGDIRVGGVTRPWDIRPWIERRVGMAGTRRQSSRQGNKAPKRVFSIRPPSSSLKGAVVSLQPYDVSLNVWLI